MLPRSERLTRSDFELLKKQSKRVHGELCTISYLHTPTFGVGVVVSKKVAKRAVDRNLLRRRVYAVFREVKHRLKTAYIVVFMKKESSQATFEEVERDIVQVLEKATLLVAKKDTQ